jgi:C-terminal processing protease CtpA/Prc
VDDLKNVLKLSLIFAFVVLLVGGAFLIGYQAGSGVDLSGNENSATERISSPPARPTSTEAPADRLEEPTEPPTDSPSPSPKPSPSPSTEPRPTSEAAQPTDSTQEQESGQLEPTRVEPTQEVEPTREAALTDEEALQVLREVWDLIDAEFYGELPTPDERIYGAIRGMLGTLDDQHTSFLEPSFAEIGRINRSGSFEGIGAMVGLNDEGIVEIVSPFSGQPADAAGLLPHDMVLAVDGQSIVGFSLDEAVALIRGPEGSEVVLTIQRGAGSEPFDVTIVRARIEIPIVESRMLEDGIGYVSLSQFNGQATSQLEMAIEELLDQGATALIFDLRDDPGGFLDQAVAVSDSTFGKGSVQVLFTLSDGSELRVTIARWFTPDDRAIHGEGLTPDIEVSSPFSDLRDTQEQLDGLVEDLAQGRIDQKRFDELSARYREEIEEIEQRIDEEFDPQLERALEFLRTGQ